MNRRAVLVDHHLDRAYVIAAQHPDGSWYACLSYFDRAIRDSWLAGLRREASGREVRAAQRYSGGWAFEDSTPELPSPLA